MADLAQLNISITDESSYSDGVETLIPLYVFATKENKVIDETTGEIAIGTTKQLANQLSVVTSKNDVITKFGTPNFTETNGTIQQSSELNEVGLYGLFDALGSTSLAYALRADIDLSQLEDKESEPVGPAQDGTKWLDLNNSEFGLFECTNDSTKIKSKQWSELDYKIAVSDNIENVEEGTKILKVLGKEIIFGKFEENEFVENDIDYIQTSINYPSNPTLNQTWLRTTPVNGGADISMKTYSEDTGKWTEEKIPVCSSFFEAEQLLTGSLEYGKMIFKSESKSRFKLYMYSPRTISPLSANIVVNKPCTELKSFVVKFFKDGIMQSIIYNNDNNYDAETLNTELSSIFKKYGLTCNISYDDTNTTFTVSGSVLSLYVAIDSQSSLVESSEVWEEVNFDVKVSDEEPVSLPEDGTLWFNSDLKIDIMVNDGIQWQGYLNKYPEAKIYSTSKKPLNPTDYSLWINTADPNYPTIYKSLDNNWVLIDNTDQTTPDGIIFADARQFATKDCEDVLYSVNNDTGEINSDLLTSNFVEPDCPNPLTYPEGMLLFNTRFSTNNVKQYSSNPFDGLYNDDYSYTVGGQLFKLNPDKLGRWVSASGNNANGSGNFGSKAQRAMVVKALASAVASNKEIRSYEYDFFFATCPGYPELDDELTNLNVDKKEMFEIVTDTPKTLEPDGVAIQEWGSNANNASSHGLDGRIIRNEYMVRHYPSMCLTSNTDGSEIAVPTSIIKMKNLLSLSRGQICAGSINGQVSNASSVGYITSEGEYSSVSLDEGLGTVCVSQSINPIMSRYGSGLLIWGENTENNITSSLSDEHAIITLLRLKRELEKACTPYFFRINNDSLITEFTKSLQSVLNIFIGTGEIYDYAVETGDSVNTPERINRKELWAEIAIEISKGVEMIYIPVRIVSTGTLSGN